MNISHKLKRIGIALILICCHSLSFADSWKVEGIIAELDSNTKTVVLNAHYGGALRVQILPYTEIEMDDCGPFGTDMYGTFKDLRVGMFAEVKIFPQNFSYPATTANNNLPLARKIEVECGKFRAY